MAYYRRRGCICKNKKKCTCGAKWSFTVDIGVDPVTRKRKQKTVSGFSSKKEAQIAAEELERQVRNKTYINETDQTLNQVIDEWVEWVAKNNMRPSTLNNRMGIINSRIKPKLGHVKIKDIEPSTVHSLYNKMINEEGLSKSYARTVHNLLSTIFKYAIKSNKVKINIMEKVDAPIPEHKEMQTWSVEEIDKFLNETKDAPTHITYVLAIYIGMRMGEILGLRWKDIDFNNKTIHIVQTLVRIGGGFDFQEPKTKNSKRQITITDDVIEELKKHKEQQKTESELVVTTSIGTPYSPRNLQRNFNMFIDRAKVTKIRFHDLRHTHATLLLKLGENPKIVSERLGHSKITVTLDTYSHVLPDMQKQASENFSNLLRGQNVVKTDK
ncbi:tyrosine-type recombinase/integrase [Ornithinibacillus sp. 179-J 7C1 HS]|uniref:site-specific integrase n=1 Tax=Ornithinibacillus sp. 179-J 7C1 HS TaxID=3142384 RepID=UPI0039A14FC3